MFCIKLIGPRRIKIYIPIYDCLSPRSCTLWPGVDKNRLDVHTQMGHNEMYKNLIVLFFPYYVGTPKLIFPGGTSRKYICVGDLKIIMLYICVLKRVRPVYSSQLTNYFQFPKHMHFVYIYILNPIRPDVLFSTP